MYGLDQSFLSMQPKSNIDFIFYGRSRSLAELLLRLRLNRVSGKHNLYLPFTLTLLKRSVRFDNNEPKPWKPMMRESALVKRKQPKPATNGDEEGKKMHLKKYCRWRQVQTEIQ